MRRWLAVTGALAVAGVLALAWAQQPAPVAEETPWSRFLWKAQHAHTVWAAASDANLTWEEGGYRIQIDLDAEQATVDTIQTRRMWSAGELMLAIAMRGPPARVSEPWDAWEPTVRQVWDELRTGLPTTGQVVEWPGQFSDATNGDEESTRRLLFAGAWDDGVAIYLSVSEEGDPLSLDVLDPVSHAELWSLTIEEWHWDVPLSPDLWELEPANEVVPIWRDMLADEIPPSPESNDDRWTYFERMVRYKLPLDAAASTGFIAPSGEERPNARLEWTCAAKNTAKSQPITLVYTTSPGSEPHVRGAAAAAAGCPLSVKLAALSRHDAPAGSKTMVTGAWTLRSLATSPPTTLMTWPISETVTGPKPAEKREQRREWWLPPGYGPDGLELRFDGQLTVVCTAQGAAPARVGHGATDDRPAVLTWPGCYPEYDVIP